MHHEATACSGARAGKVQTMGTNSRTGILVSILGGYAFLGLGALLIANAQGSSSPIAWFASAALLVGSLAYLVGWVWAIVVTIQHQRWGWLVSMIIFNGLAPLLYGLMWPGPVVTGALGVDKRMAPGPAMPPSPSMSPTPGTPSAASGQWEYCQIEYQAVGAYENQGYFWANAVGPRGQYTAAQNRGRCKAERYVSVLENIPVPGRGCQELLNELIGALTADGWELTGEKGSHPWNHKFRRLVTR